MTTVDADASVITRLHRAFNERDAATFEALLADDVVWHETGSHAMAGSFTGRDELWRRWAGRLWDTAARVEDHAVLARDDHEHTAVLFEVVHDFGDGEVRLRGVEVARVVDGRVAERWAFDEDPEHVDDVVSRHLSGAETDA